jgi:hypothetical protein
VRRVIQLGQPARIEAALAACPDATPAPAPSPALTLLRRTRATCAGVGDHLASALQPLTCEGGGRDHVGRHHADARLLGFPYSSRQGSGGRLDPCGRSPAADSAAEKGRTDLPSRPSASLSGRLGAASSSGTTCHLCGLLGRHRGCHALCAIFQQRHGNLRHFGLHACTGRTLPDRSDKALHSAFWVRNAEIRQHALDLFAQRLDLGPEQIVLHGRDRVICQANRSSHTLGDGPTGQAKLTLQISRLAGGTDDLDGDALPFGFHRRRSSSNEIQVECFTCHISPYLLAS